VGVEENKKTVQMVEEAWDRGDLDSIAQFFSPKFDNSASGVPGLPPGLEGAQIAHGMSMSAFPDRKVEIVEMMGEGNKVMTRNRITGTNKGGVPWFGAPEPNDAKIDFQFIGIYEFDDMGKIVAHYGLNDAYMLSIQLGAITPPQM
jgi:predicted ester cyclase